MSKYLDYTELNELNELRKMIFALRAQGFQKHKIDILDNDTLSALSIYEVVVTYDSGYSINFSRNGEDASSNGVPIEQKCSRIKRRVRKGYGEAQFMFHAMGDLNYPRYIFATRDEADLRLLRIYDISNDENTKAIQSHLAKQRRNWLKNGIKDKQKMKRDVITVPESLLKELSTVEPMQVNGVEVYRG